MTVFTGSIQLSGAPGEDLETSLTVESGRLIVTSREHEIGNWSVDEVSAERGEAHFRIHVEGEDLIVAVADPEGFAQALGVRDRKQSRGTKLKLAKRSRRKERPEPDVGTPAVPPAASQRVRPAPPPDSEKEPSRPEPSWWSRLPRRLKLAGGGVLGLAVLGVLLPGLLALLFLLAGMLTLFLGIAARSDSGSGLLPPPFFATTTAAVAGIALVLLGVVIIAAT
jgi:hypothetical protein